MWWRFLTFCVLLLIILFIVLSCIQGRPVIGLFFHRCCEDEIENHQTIYENFGTNFFMRERLVADFRNDTDVIEANDDAVEMIAAMSDIFDVHDPKTRVNIQDYEIEEINDKNDTIVDEENLSVIEDSTTETSEISDTVTTESSEIELTTIGSRARKKKIL
ncbi:hypothetical protein MSG28_012612 [Choristoneura fumiferana]|uniref:Uncharacterized protein n=1 Tax=Choristoneura fumiferana TaxID=7141 RepID=A0ACC0JHC3_CHOFU|nr:hypothetical protein MSG28_012612 [Choristoneura fumiferana]